MRDSSARGGTWRGEAGEVRQRFCHCPPTGLRPVTSWTHPWVLAGHQAQPVVGTPVRRCLPSAHHLRPGATWSTGHPGQKGEDTPNIFASTARERRGQSGGQRPHRGLTSAAGLQDVVPGALGH